MTNGIDWTYTKPHYGDLPAGYLATTEHFSITSGKLNVSTSCGLGVISKQQVGEILVFQTPASVEDLEKFQGVLLFDSTNYRLPNQAKRSHNPDDIVNCLKVGEARVHTSTAVNVNDKVYLVYQDAGQEKKGMFKNTASTNAGLIKNARWKYNFPQGVATLSLFNPA